MSLIIIFIFLVLLFLFSVFFRTFVTNLHLVVPYGIYDISLWLARLKWRILNSGYIFCFVGLFGKGKTLSAVHYVTDKYRRYNNKLIYDSERKKYVTQKVKILSNVSLNIPYVPFVSLQQIVDIAKTQHEYDLENDIKTVTIVLGDEFSVQLNSRQFKNNIDALFLNTLLTCRHYNISIVYTSQRFAHVDALLRQVTSQVIDCNKIWRIMIHSVYDAWDYENASQQNLIKPIRRFGWFVRNRDYNAYDTFACVSNLIKSTEEHDMITEAEILSLQQIEDSNDMAIGRRSRRWKKLYQKH